MSSPSEHQKNSPLLSKSLLTPEQNDAVDALYEANRLVFGKMGVGKTIIAATAIAELLDDKELRRVLIVTTPKIAKTVWAQEFAKWEHTAHITVGIATGNPEQRYNVINNGDNQVVVITFNTLADFCKRGGCKLFDGLLIDESTKLKSPGGVGFKSLKSKLKKFTWCGALTGTPTSEDFLSLYSQMYLIDGGIALGRSFQRYKETYFYPTDYKQYNWVLSIGSDRLISEQVKNLIHVVPDYTSELPPINYHPIYVEPPVDVKDFYATMKKDMVVGDVVAVNAAVLTMKLQQVASGWAYDEDGDTLRISNFKVEALVEILGDLNSPTIVCYWFQEELAAIKEALPHAMELNPANPLEAVDMWNAGDVDVLLIHPRSAGHGLNLAAGGHNIIWFSPQWSRDLWEQTNARLWRRGQEHPVDVYTLITDGTIEEAVAERVGDKAKFEKMLLTHLKTN